LPKEVTVAKPIAKKPGTQPVLLPGTFTAVHRPSAKAFFFFALSTVLAVVADCPQFVSSSEPHSPHVLGQFFVTGSLNCVCVQYC